MCDSRKFSLSELVSAFCVKSVWGLVACSCVRGLDIGAGINREPSLTNFSAQRETAGPRNCARENCKVRKVSAKKRENGPDDESPHFGPAQEYERVSRRK